MALECSGSLTWPVSPVTNNISHAISPTHFISENNISQASYNTNNVTPKAKQLILCYKPLSPQTQRAANIPF